MFQSTCLKKHKVFLTLSVLIIFFKISAQNMTYYQAVDVLHKSLNDTVLNNLKLSPIYLSEGFVRENYKAYDSIAIKDYTLQVSTAFVHGHYTPIHFEDVPYYIMKGLWKKLNPNYISFRGMPPQKYFDAIFNIIQNKNLNEPITIASLPEWVFSNNIGRYWYNFEEENIYKDYAEKLLSENKEISKLAAIYLMNINVRSKGLKNWIDSINNKETKVISLPKFASKTKSYHWENIYSKELALKYYSSLYQKDFTSQENYQSFINSSNKNHIAYWRYIDTLSYNDYDTLIKKPKKLIEILILSGNYYYPNTNNDELIYQAYNTTDELVKYIEKENKISVSYPYYHISERYDLYRLYSNSRALKAINALKFLASNLSDEELFEMLSPEAKNDYENNLKIEVFFEYKAVRAFLLATQYERLLNYHDKNKSFEVCKYYWNKEFISWTIRNFIAELLLQIDKKNALKVFMKNFSEPIDNNSHTRQAILRALIKYNFKQQNRFIEKWYWKVKDKNFNCHPKEDFMILESLKTTSSETLKLYNKIINDKRSSKKPN